MSEELMRLMIVRPPDASERGEREELEEPAVITAARSEDGSLEHAEALDVLIGSFEGSESDLVRDVGVLEYGPELLAFRDRVTNWPGDETLQLSQLVQEVFSQPAEELVEAEEWREARRRANDSLIALELGRPEGPRPVGPLADALRAKGGEAQPYIVIS